MINRQMFNLKSWTHGRSLAEAYILAEMAAKLNRPRFSLSGLQKRFELIPSLGGVCVTDWSQRLMCWVVSTLNRPKSPVSVNAPKQVNSP